MPILGIEYYLSYGLAFLLGIVILLAFSLEKFDKPYPGNQYISELLPSSLSPGSSYIKAFLVYFCIIVIFYAVICIFLSTATGVWEVFFGEGATKKFLSQTAGTSTTQTDSVDVTKKKPIAPAEIPLIIALLMVGLFPKYKQFGEIEAPIRRFAHRLIGIPQGLDDQTVQIASTPLASIGKTDDETDREATVRFFLGYRLLEMPAWMRDKLAGYLELPELRAPVSENKKARRNKEEDKPSGKDLTDDEKTLWRSQLEELRPALRVADKWARATRLLDQIYQEPAPDRAIIDQAARRKYDRLRRDLRVNYDEVKLETAKAGAEQKKLIELVATLLELQDGDDEAISESDLADVIDSLRTLMKKRLDELTGAESRIDEILAKAHVFIAGSRLLKTSKVSDSELMKYYGLRDSEVVVRTSIDDVLLAIITMVGLLFIFNFFLYHTLKLFNLTDDNPSLTALSLTVSALMMHGTAAIIAFAWRGRWPKQENNSGDTNRQVRGYLGLGLTVYLVVYSGLLAWAAASLALSSKATASPIVALWFLSNLELAIALAVLSLSAVGTAVFTALYIGQAERSNLSIAAIGVRAFVQGAFTAFVVLVSNQILLPGDTYFAVTSSLNGFVVGATLGAAVLKLASKRQPRQPSSPVLLEPPALIVPPAIAR